MRTSRVALFAALGLAAVAGGALAWRAHGHHVHVAATDAEPPASRPPVTVRPRPSTEPLPGDPVLGRALYAVHCASCHGPAGAGDGPAAAALHPRPRDHTDAWQLEARSDRELHRMIQEGGPSIQRSPLMPAFGDSLDPLDAWALVAHVRTLHPRVVDAFPTAARWEQAEAVLDRPAATRAAALEGRTEPAPSDHRAAWLDAFDAADRPLGRVAFPRVELSGVAVRLVVAVDPSGRPVVARTLELLATEGGELETDHLLGPPASAASAQKRLRDAAERALVQLEEGPKAREADARAADEVRARWAANPAAFGEGARTFLQSCAHCHGATGRLVGGGLQPQQVRPRNLGDPAFQASVDDEHLRRTIRGGGAATGLSPIMPAHGHLSDAQLQELVRFIRSLAPQGTRSGAP
jgi:mono/diheme cytochrome c family protein